MKLIIDRGALSEAVSDVMKAISTRTTIPILTGMKIETTEEGLTLTGSNSEISIQRFIPLLHHDIQQVEIIEQGSIVLQAHFFADIIHKLPSETVEMTVQDRQLTNILSGQAEFNLNGLDAEEYPRLPYIDEPNTFKVKANDLRTVIKQTVFAVSDSETRPVLTGVQWKIENEELRCVATDSHRLAMSHVNVLDQTEKSSLPDVVIPGKSLTELAKLLAHHNEDVEVTVTESQVLFKTKHTLFYSRLLEGKYPETSKLIPTDSKTMIELERKPFLHAIERASLLAKEEHNNVVKLVNDGEKRLEISSHSPEIGQVFEQIRPLSYQGDELKISFSALFMLDALKTIDSDTITISFTGSMRPFLIRAADDPSILQLILPVRTY